VWLGWSGIRVAGFSIVSVFIGEKVWLENSLNQTVIGCFRAKAFA